MRRFQLCVDTVIALRRRSNLCTCRDSESDHDVNSSPPSRVPRHRCRGGRTSCRPGRRRAPPSPRPATRALRLEPPWNGPENFDIATRFSTAHVEFSSFENDVSPLAARCERFRHLGPPSLEWAVIFRPASCRARSGRVNGVVQILKSGSGYTFPR